MSYRFYLSFIRLPIILRTLLIALTFITFFGSTLHIIEPNTYPTILDGIWWAIITASTVGYGDYVPHTTLGKLAAVLLIITSAGFLSTFFITLATTAVTRQNELLEGKADYRGKDHYIIIGWNERSRQMIYSLIKNKKSVSIALIDETLTKNPLLDKNLHFIKGPPNQDDILTQAHISAAKKVIITADANKGELEADMNTILTLLAVKGLNPKVETIVEVLTNEQIANANRAGADEIIQTNILTSFVMLQSIKSQDMVTSFLDLLYQLTEEKISFHEVDKEDFEKNYISISNRCINEGKILLGVKRGEATILNPPQPFMIEKNDQLIIIS